MQTKPRSSAARVPGLLSWQAWLVGAAMLVLAAPGCSTAPPPAAPKPPEVDVTEPVQEDVTDYAVFTGNVQAEKSVNLVAQATGYLLPEPMPKEGFDVKKDQPLFKIDPRLYQAALEQAKADTATAEDVYKRDRASPIATTEAALQQDLDAYKKAQALQESAQLNLDFTDIKAPFDGRISRRLVDPGNLVTANVTVLASLVSLDPIYAYFDVDERTLLRIHKLVDAGIIPPESIKGKNLPVNLALSDEGMSFTYTAEDVKKDALRRHNLSSDDIHGTPAAEVGVPRHPGHIVIVQNQENAQTGTLRMWGEFPNPVALAGQNLNPAPRLLSPGMFARIQLPIGPPQLSILVKEACLVSDQNRTLLYVVQDLKDKDGKVLMDEKGKPRQQAIARYVTTGPAQNGLRVIEPPGLKLGEKVVLNGQQRVHDKGEVRIRPPADGQGSEAAATK